jgi:hypothetical protein
MEHKAFEFDWDSFDKELLSILIPSLQIEDCEPIISFIKSNQHLISDPYEGSKLDVGWEEKLSSLPILDIADHALTKYYSVNKDIGLGDSWLAINEYLSQREIDALLGSSFKVFDPGCYGSYFQTERQLRDNVRILASVDNQIIKEYVSYLSSVHKGLYVTF